ncbi:MAG: PEP-CTERM sorting domain-containing protein [Planctomycetes bacterium]|nr:PEP-CTERM sorting domain-containing protein [Planctomycetota bacterium]
MFSQNTIFRSSHSKMCNLLTIIATYVLVSLCAATSQAAIVTITSSNGIDENRVQDGSPADDAATSQNEQFSTYNSGGNIHASYVRVTNANLLAALQTALGPAPGYTINSAVFRAGTAADDYAVLGGGVYTTATYNPATLNWNNQPNAGGVPAGTLLGTGTLFTSNTTEWNVLAGVNTVSDIRFFFPTSLLGSTGANFYTNSPPITNMGLTLVLDAEAQEAAVPEPSTFVLAALGLAGLGLVAWRGRK